MSRREFRFGEGHTHKFWAITVEGKGFAVQFGKVGTAGQTQTKEFGSDAEARKAADKLIAEKTKKGYAEVTSHVDAASARAAPAAAVKKSRKQQDPESAPAAPPPAPVAPVVTHVIDLDPEDWFWAAWRKLPPLSPPEKRVPPFDREQCLARLDKLAKNAYNWWDWARLNVAHHVSPEEARFWFLVFTGLDRTASVATRVKLAGKLSREDLTKPMPPDDVKGLIAKLDNSVPIDKVLCHLATWSSPAELVELLRTSRLTNLHWNTMTDVLAWYTREVFPRLPASDADRIRAEVREELKVAKWPTDYYQRPALAFFLAALLGLHDEVLSVVRAWPDDFYGKSDWDDYYHQPQRVVFGLGSAELVAQQMRRLRLRLHKPEFARAWLAHTELTALEYLRDRILDVTNKNDADKLVEVLSLVRAPEAAPHLLQLVLESKAPKRAREWLDAQPGNAVAGLIPVAAGRGKLADAAIAYLREAKKQEHAEFIAERLKAAPPEVAAKVRQDVLDHAEKVYAPFDDKTTPDWLRDALAAPAGKPAKWPEPERLPPLVVGERRLNGRQTAGVLAALRQSALGAPQPVVKALRQHADRAALDAFAWQLFGLWQEEGCPAKEKWAFLALGHFGGDASALKLAPLVRAWPGESQHARAVTGLEVLRAVGSDTALTQLSGIAQKLKFKGLQNKAKEMMDAVASDLGLTRQQLEDRIVPDLGLDERGGRTLDFGPRQFHLVLSSDLKPLVRDEAGKVKPDLPKPGAKDDAAKAGAALADWKLLKKQLRDAVKVQVVRLEQAMVTGRRWAPADFERLLVRHPLMVNLVRRLLWGGYDRKSKLVRLLRVTEEQEYADAEDRPATLDGLASVGIIHPLHLSEGQRAAWGQVFGDYELISPFPQLGRGVHALLPAEKRATEITRFSGPKIPMGAVLGTLENLGWTRGNPQDAGWVGEHHKHFAAAGVTAVLCYDPGFSVGWTQGWEDQKIERTYFLADADKATHWFDRRKAVKLETVDPVVLSEVLGDLTLLASKGK
jgi:predicted DNA-binding WGR domain protein